MKVQVDMERLDRQGLTLYKLDAFCMSPLGLT
jgi:hypothetical protein